MGKAKVIRMPLSFASLQEVGERLDLLCQKGYDQAGNWNLSQICEHLRDWFLYMIEGYPKAPIPINWMLWGVRRTVGRSFLTKILRDGKMPSGAATISKTIHLSTEFDDSESVRRLKAMITRFQLHQGAYCTSPVFGDFSAEEGMQLQLIHCAHHLSFLIPK